MQRHNEYMVDNAMRMAGVTRNEVQWYGQPEATEASQREQADDVYVPQFDPDSFTERLFTPFHTQVHAHYGESSGFGMFPSSIQTERRRRSRGDFEPEPYRWLVLSIVGQLDNNLMGCSPVQM